MIDRQKYKYCRKTQSLDLVFYLISIQLKTDLILGMFLGHG